MDRHMLCKDSWLAFVIVYYYRSTKMYQGSLLTQWFVIGCIFLSLQAPSYATSYGPLQREDTPDFFEEYWSDDRSPGRNAEVRRLLEHPENKRFVRSLDSQYYQITYPQQIQRHGKSQGMAARDATKVAGLSDRKMKNMHVHRTSYRIKAFSHVFTVELELNTQLLSSSVRAHHKKKDGSTQVDHNIERCYYHGTVKDYAGAVAAFRTCNGLSGIIQLGNETLIVSPMAGGDNMAKQPHFVIEAKSSHIRQKCGNQMGYEWRSRERGGYNRGGTSSHGRKRKQTHHRYKRDLRTNTKYIDTALFLDKKFMEERNFSLVRGMHDALQIANIADLYFKTINTRIIITYLETWNERNFIKLEKDPPISMTMIDFYEMVSRRLDKFNKDTSHLITGEKFQGGESGMGVPNSICTSKAAGISVDLNLYEPHLVASTMTHMIGHNLHMKHDELNSNCYCQDWHGCLMAKNVVGQDNVQPSKFSKCAVEDFHNALQNDANTMCLLNTFGIHPDYRLREPDIGKHASIHCGNGKVDPGEHCDCGQKCSEVDQCCDPKTCQLRMDAECATGPCCSQCKLKPKGTLCRAIQTECDIPEHCDGTHGTCPADIYYKNGKTCGPGNTGYCFHGICPTIDEQCKIIWGYGGKAADKSCFSFANIEGVNSGNCGRYRNGSYVKCEIGDIMCGTLQCQKGEEQPAYPNIDQRYAKTVIQSKGKNFECKTITPQMHISGGNDYNLVRDGTACGDKLICINQTCVSLYPYLQQRCLTNNNALECSGHGVCSNINTCYCDPGWEGPDCSTYNSDGLHHSPTHAPIPPPGSYSTASGQIGAPAVVTTEDPTPGRNTTYVGTKGSDTVFLVAILVSGVGGVFLLFAFMALCYRRKGSMPKYDPPYMKPIVKKPPQTHMHSGATSKTEETSLDLGGRIISFATPTYNNREPCREHKMSSIKRQMGPSAGGSSQSDEETLQSGEEETVSFIELPSNNVNKIPERGILKKSYGLLSSGEKEKWEDSHSDNNDGMSQSDNNGEAECQVTEVERTLNSLNGYHEDIISAIKRAASHRAGGRLGGTSSLSSDELRTVHHEPYPRFSSAASTTGEFPRLKSSHEKLVDSGGEDDQVPQRGPFRIRNLEDLIRQLEQHPNRHMSPSGSEDIRMSETEADRHYRLETGSCTESQRYMRSWRRNMRTPTPEHLLQNSPVHPHIYSQDIDTSTIEGLSSSLETPDTPGDKLSDILRLASPEDHENIIRAAAMLTPESPESRVRDNTALAFMYGHGRYRPPPGSIASGSGSGGRSTDRISSGLAGLEFSSDGVESHGAYNEEDDLDRVDGADAADSESDEFVVLPKSLRSHSDHYFWPLNK